jgi:hypothetical protein
MSLQLQVFSSRVAKHCSSNSWTILKGVLPLIGAAGSLGLLFFCAPSVAQEMLPITQMETEVETNYNNSAGSAAVASALDGTLNYQPPPGTGTPPTRGGTGSRGGCVFKEDLPPLTGLVGQEHLMLTVSEQPTIWIYTPYSAEEAPSGSIYLQQGRRTVFRGTFDLQEVAAPGIVGINFPADLPPLEIGEDYRWVIDVNCIAPSEATATSDDGLDPAIFRGQVQRVEISPALADDLAKAETELDRVAAFGANSIWYDMLTELARLRMLSGPDADALVELEPYLEAAWVDLLSDEENVGLQDFAEVPLVGETTAIVVTASSQPE